jgi:hypothetical protein
MQLNYLCADYARLSHHHPCLRPACTEYAWSTLEYDENIVKISLSDAR